MNKEQNIEEIKAENDRVITDNVTIVGITYEEVKIYQKTSEETGRLSRTYKYDEKVER